MSQQHPDSEPPVAKHAAETSPDEALKYWTADKMRKAKPAPMPHVDNVKRAKQSRPQPPEAPGAPDVRKPDR